ncbi:hypothetical protein GR212_36320 [Rhizobium lusitanum]|uniref:Uncharacterized protein n=1 Tax=Rhizobium lusitanum TaxID=293958 RepID=A0A6L9UK83_9HYPH|nr:hypothetical protein [Rhizobium lusitanum]NEI74998.1 hypothetical protein [Rhizobium lusitanum]
MNAGIQVQEIQPEMPVWSAFTGCYRDQSSLFLKVRHGFREGGTVAYPGNRGLREHHSLPLNCVAAQMFHSVWNIWRQCPFSSRKFQDETMYPRDLNELIFAIVILLMPVILGAAALLYHLGWIR